jgi:phosphohistidine phosphatase
MKSLLVVRHAKSSWDWEDLNDFERPLSGRGTRDAPDMAARVAARHGIPDLLVSSPAKRAKKTAQLFAETWEKPQNQILYIAELYHAPAAVFYDVVTHLPEDKDSIAIFSHNPGITAFVNELTEVRVDNMPTCGVFAIKVDRWKDFKNAKKEFWFFDYPKAEAPGK